jgi:hypothetical protein
MKFKLFLREESVIYSNIFCIKGEGVYILAQEIMIM